MTKSIFRFFAALLALFVAASAVAQTSALPQAGPLITSPIDNSVRVRIAHSTHPLAKSKFDVGTVEANTMMQRMILVLKSSPDQEAQLQAFLDSQQTKGSPDYHRWLTPAEFGARFGPSQQDLQQVTDWLHQQGFLVNQVAQSGRWIEFSGMARQVQAAFQTQMRQYQIAGKMHVANATDLSIPAALAPVVAGPLSLHNFVKKPMISHFGGVRRNEQGRLVPISGPDLTTPRGNHFLAPADFASIYDSNPLLGTINGAGQTIGIVARSNVSNNDVATFRNIFGLSPASNITITVNGQDPGVDTIFGDGIEAILDTEWSGAVAPVANINVVVSGSTLTTDGVDLSASYIVENNLADIMSVSFGDCERNLGTTENNFFNSLWQQAAAQGISVFVSSGDDGPAGCDDPNPNSLPASGIVGVSGLASTPFNTAVGGTEFNETINGNTAANFWNATNGNNFESAKGYIPEMVWNESCSPGQVGTDCQGQQFFELFASSGGASTLYSKPSWQSGVTGIPADGVRDIPDVSLSAAGHDGYIICFQEDPTIACQTSGGVLTNAAVVGGTSASSPSFAGIMALIDQKVGGRQGLANYVLYNLAKAANFSNCNSNNRTNPAVGTSCVFNDTTTGNNSVPNEAGFIAGTGYDLTTGLGSVDVNNLANAWATAVGGLQGSKTTLNITSPALTAGTLQITHGQTVMATIGVAPVTSGTPTGNVALVTNASGTGGNGTATVGAGSLTSGSFSGSFNNLPGGIYTLSAHYPGNGVFGASDSTGIPAKVTAEGSTTSLQGTIINVNTGLTEPISTPVPYGDTTNIIVFDGTVAGLSGAGFPTGTMNFSDGSNSIASGVPLSIGGSQNASRAEVANCFTPVTCLTIGTHNITASYPTGDNSFNSSGPSNTVSITITKGNPSVTVNPASNVSGGTPVFISGAVGTGFGTIAPTGTVQFFDGGSAIGSPATVFAGGGASTQVTFNSSGTHNLTAQYSGDSTYNGASSPIQAITVVAPFAFGSSVGGNNATVAAGGTATYNLLLQQAGGGSFTGAVSITCTGAPAGTTCSAPGSANASAAGTPITVTVATTTSAQLRHAPFRTWSPVFAGVLGILVCGVGRKRKLAMLMLLSILMVVGVTACGGGGGGGGNNFRPPTIATLTVTGTSGSFTNSINLNLTITH